MPASCHSPSRIAVTGATGFVGRVLVARMAAAGLRPQLLLRRDAADLEALASKVVRGDLRDPEALAALVEGADTLVHLGGLIAAARVRDFQAVNVEATAALARLARAAGVQRVLQVSSLAAREPQLSPYARSEERRVGKEGRARYERDAHTR